MKQTAVEKMIQYFIKQKNNGASHWCIDDLIAQLHQAKAMEKEQIFDALEVSKIERLTWGISKEQYYNETFKSE